MAMGGLDREDFSAPMAEINTTPLVDVMLVLLVIFLVTAPMLTQAVKLELPNETTTEVADENPITLSLTKDDHYFWGEESLSEQQLIERLTIASQETTKRPIHLRVDKNVPYAKLSKFLALAQKHKMTNIGFVTEPK